MGILRIGFALTTNPIYNIGALAGPKQPMTKHHFSKVRKIKIALSAD